MDLYRLKDNTYTFTALATSVVSSDAISSECWAIIINATEPVFIKISPHGEDATTGSGGDFIKDEVLDGKTRLFSLPSSKQSREGNAIGAQRDKTIQDCFSWLSK